MPSRSITLRPFALTKIVTLRPRLGTQKVRRWMLTFQRLELRRWEWEMDFPKLGTAPVTWHRCADMSNKLVMRIVLVKCYSRPL